MVLLTVTGELTLRSKHALRTAVAKALAQYPRFVVVDLNGLTDHTHTVPATCQALHTTAEQDYGVTLMWCPPSQGWLGDRLRTAYWRQTLHVYPDRQTATAAMDTLATHPQRVEATLPPVPESCSHARLLVGDACIAWGLPELAEPARRIIFELVHNAATHAATDIRVSAARRGRYLYLSVRDDSVTPPRLLPWIHQPGWTPATAGAGLRTIELYTTAWGSTAHGTGKRVWAVLRIPARPEGTPPPAPPA